MRKQVWSACCLLVSLSCLAQPSALKMEVMFLQNVDFHRIHDVTSQKTQLFETFISSKCRHSSLLFKCRGEMSQRPKRLILVTLPPREDHTEDGTNSIFRMLQSYEASLGLSVVLSKRNSAHSNGRVNQDSDGAVGQEHLNFGFESRLVYVRV